MPCNEWRRNNGTRTPPEYELIYKNHQWIPKQVCGILETNRLLIQSYCISSKITCYRGKTVTLQCRHLADILLTKRSKLTSPVIQPNSSCATWCTQRKDTTSFYTFPPKCMTNHEGMLDKPKWTFSKYLILSLPKHQAQEREIDQVKGD